MGFDTGKKAHNSVGFFMGAIPGADHPRTEFIQIFSFRVNLNRLWTVFNGGELLHKYNTTVSPKGPESVAQ